MAGQELRGNNTNRLTRNAVGSLLPAPFTSYVMRSEHTLSITLSLLRPALLRNQRDERLRRFDCRVEEVFRHETHEQRTRTRLAIHRAFWVELDIRETSVPIQPRQQPFAMRVDRIDVQPVVEGCLRLQREASTLEIEADQPSGLPGAGTAFGTPGLRDVGIRDGPARLEHLAALKRAFQRHLAVSPACFQMKRAQMRPDLLGRL